MEPTTATIYINVTATNSSDWLSQNSQVDGFLITKTTSFMCYSTLNINNKTSFGNKQ